MVIRSGLAIIAIIVATTGTPSLADADDACVGVTTDLTDQLITNYADLIVNAFSEDLEPSERFQSSDVEIYKFLESDDWSAVLAAIPTADIGMFFFEEGNGEKQFKDVWGGMPAEPSERPDLIQWAEALGAPQALATCFADQMIGDEEESPFGFTIDLSFSTKALDHLTEIDEMVIVSASYYGDPSSKGQEFSDDVGKFDLGTEDVQLPVTPGIVLVTGDQVGEDDLQWIDGDPNVNVNVFTARLSDDHNLIACDFIDGSLDDVIRAMPVALHCALIEEGNETELKP